MNSKIYNGNVQPNPKEFKIWVNDEGTIKTWNGTKWVEATAGGGGSGNSEDTYQYYRVDKEIYDNFINVDILPFVILTKGIYDDRTSPVNGTKIIGAPYEVGAAMIEQVMCYNGKSIIGDKEINEGDWKKNVSEYLFILLGASEENGIQTSEDVLKHLDGLVPITKEEFYSLETQS